MIEIVMAQTEQDNQNIKLGCLQTVPENLEVWCFVIIFPWTNGICFMDMICPF